MIIGFPAHRVLHIKVWMPKPPLLCGDAELNTIILRLSCFQYATVISVVLTVLSGWKTHKEPQMLLTTLPF